MGARRIMQCFTVSMFALVLLAAFAHAQTSTCSAGDADLCYDPTPAGSGVITHRATLNGVTQETYKGTVKLVSENAYGALIGVLDAGNYTAKNGYYTEITSFYAGTSSRRTSIVVDFRAVVNQALWTPASPPADVGVLQPACDKVIDAPTAASY